MATAQPAIATFGEIGKTGDAQVVVLSARVPLEHYSALCEVTGEPNVSLPLCSSLFTVGYLSKIDSEDSVPAYNGVSWRESR